MIGRLDEQVEAVLIAPLNADTKATRQKSAPQEPSAEAAGHAAPPPHGAQTSDENERATVGRSVPAALPVWML